MTLIPNTYSDDLESRRSLIEAMYDKTTIERDIITYARKVKDDVNAYLGRTTDFTPAALTLTRNKPIVSAASQLTAALMELNPQEGNPTLTQEGLRDKTEAYARLALWKEYNNIKPRVSTSSTILHVQTEAVYCTK